MSKFKFHDQLSLAEEAEKLGKKAVEQGLISNFAIRFFSDSWQFYLADDQQSEPLTPEEAYLQLKKLVERDN